MAVGVNEGTAESVVLPTQVVLRRSCGCAYDPAIEDPQGGETANSHMGLA